MNEDVKDVGKLPLGWYILWDERSYTSIVWTDEVALEYEFLDEWFETLYWAVDEAVNQ